VRDAEGFRRWPPEWRIEELLNKYPGLRLVPSNDGVLVLAGTLRFAAQAKGAPRIEDEYSIELSVPSRFPAAPPRVRETGGRIRPTYHKFADDELCLGSPTRVRMLCLGQPSVVHFVDRVVVPYLYNHSCHAADGSMPLGELKHGDPGLLQDFAAIFGVAETVDVRSFVRLAGLRKRLANKHPCPCGSGRRLGRCHNKRVNRLRTQLGTRWFRQCHRSLG
jgi:hypothetical protein